MSTNLVKEVYNSGVKKGYSITDTKNYIDSLGKECVQAHVLTPYVDASGNFITGYALTPVAHGKGIRASNSVSFYVGEHNMDYMDAKDAKLFTKAGESVDFEEARNEMAQFTGAASEYPHVMCFEEWKQLSDARCKRFGLGETNPADYENVYLPKVEREMASGDVKYVGKIASRNDLYMNLAENPEFHIPGNVSEDTFEADVSCPEIC